MTSLVARLERLRGSELLAGAAYKSVSATDFDPDAEARRVLEHCRRDLNLPAYMRLEWHDLEGYWGEVQTDRPTVIRLSRRLREPRNAQQLPDTVAHECKHSQRILNGLSVYDDAAETAATDYGRSVAAAWRF